MISDTEIARGMTALKALDKASLPIEAAYWLKVDDQWKFCIETPLLLKVSRSGAYKKIQAALSRYKDSVRLREVTIVPPTNPLLRDLRSVFGETDWATEPDGYAWFEISDLSVGDSYIDDVVIYRL